MQFWIYIQQKFEVEPRKPSQLTEKTKARTGTGGWEVGRGPVTSRGQGVWKATDTSESRRLIPHSRGRIPTPAFLYIHEFKLLG